MATPADLTATDPTGPTGSAIPTAVPLPADSIEVPVDGHPDNERSNTGDDHSSDTTSPRPAQRLAFVGLAAVVFMVAACGLVYELALIALGSYLMGDSIRQTAIVLGIFVFSMGIGSLLTKHRTNRPITTFVAIECALGLLGGLSVLLLYASFAWLHLYMPSLVLIAFLIGALIGAELPLLATLFDGIRHRSTGETVADLFALDYVGALLGGLAFPFLLLPTVGLLTGTMLVGVVNVLCALALALVVFRHDLTRRTRNTIVAGTLAVLALLGAGIWFADDFEVTARQALFRDPIVRAERTPYQEIVITENPAGGRAGDVRLFLNGNLQFASIDEHRYHETLVHPAMRGSRRSVLILGGGDGLALREVLRYPDVETVTLVELDPQMIALARTDARFTTLNRSSFADPRVQVVTQDAFTFIRDNARTFDVVLIDFPDPDTPGTAKLFSVEFYGMLSRWIAPEGRVVLQASSPYFAPLVFWDIEVNLRAAGFNTTPFHVDVPSFGDWGFHLATFDVAASPGMPPPLQLPDDRPPLRFLTPEVLTAAQTFAPDQRPAEALQPSTLLQPHILDYQQRSWRAY